MYNFTFLNKNKKEKSYFLGFLFSIVLTIIPFFLIIKKILSNEISYIFIILCCITQIFIHFVCFLNLNFSSEEKWNVITLLFVIVIIFIVVFGSIWIMCDLNHHMLY